MGLSNICHSVDKYSSRACFDVFHPRGRIGNYIISQHYKYDIFQRYEYLILSYLERQDLGIIYSQLTKEERRRIAAEIVDRLNGIYDRLWTEWSKADTLVMDRRDEGS